MASSTFEAPDERHLRSASLIDQQRINRCPIALAGAGAIGSHLAEMLAKLGVMHITLIDPDEVDTINLGGQGFYEDEVGVPKVEAVKARLLAIDHAIRAETIPSLYEARQIAPGSAVFACVDSIKTRRLIFRDFCQHDWPVLFDGRMAAESLRVLCVERTEESMSRYQASLFPSHQSYRESCTARATIYCAAMAAAILTALFKQWAMGQQPEPHLHFDLLGMDCYR